MRKLFIATFSMSLLGVLLVGAALAWTARVTAPSVNAFIGKLAVALPNESFASTGKKLYPGVGRIPVTTGKIVNNTPSDPGVAVKVTDASISFPNAPLFPAQECAGFIGGDVDVDTNTPVGPGGGALGFTVFLSLASNAPNSCQGKTVTYSLTFNLKT